jgi:hypothetical protein
LWIELKVRTACRAAGSSKIAWRRSVFQKVRTKKPGIFFTVRHVNHS